MFLFTIEYIINLMHSYCLKVADKKKNRIVELNFKIKDLASDVAYADKLAEKLQPLKRDEGKA